MERRRIPVLLTAFFMMVFAAEAGAQEQVQPEVKMAHFVDATGEEFVYYSLAENRVATPQEVEDEKWDIGFRDTQIRINGSVQLLDQEFDEVTEAPMLGYKMDEPDRPALDSQAGEGWFNYDTTTHVIEPKEGQTFVIATADDKYAKLEILNYYKDDEEMAEDETGMGLPGYYSFRYIYLDDGSRQFSVDGSQDQ